MKVVIDIPDKYVSIDIPLLESISNAENDKALKFKFLPKTMGDVIDREKRVVHTKRKYKDDCWGNEDDCERCSDNCVEVQDIEKAPIIVEAYKEANNEANN